MSINILLGTEEIIKSQKALFDGILEGKLFHDFTGRKLYDDLSETRTRLFAEGGFTASLFGSSISRINSKNQKNER